MGAMPIGRWGAADLRLRAGGPSRNSNIASRCRAWLTGAPGLWALTGLCLAVMGIEQTRVLAFRAPTLRAVIETAITLSAFAATGLFGLSFWHRRRMWDLLLAGALLELGLIDLVSYVLPAAVGRQAPPGLAAGPLLGKLFMALALAVGGMAMATKQLRQGRRPLALALAAGVLGAVVAELGGLLLRGQLPARGAVTHHGVAVALQHPPVVLFALATAVLLVVAAVRTPSLRCGRRVTMLLAGGFVLLAAARLNYLVLPTPGIGWVTAREGFRIAGYGLILAAAICQEAAVRQGIVRAAATEERRRIARDLHDGLAQDLAFIAAHGDRLAAQAGEDHPLAIAARRALAVSRGAIADLSASEAPSVQAALRHVGDELEVRFGVRVSIDAEGAELNPSAREDVIRIVREAIVNAAKAESDNVWVSLTRADDRTILRVLDDGPGIESSEPKLGRGFGLKSMRERAAAQGGVLTAREAGGGGTELEVVFP